MQLKIPSTRHWSTLNPEETAFVHLVQATRPRKLSITETQGKRSRCYLRIRLSGNVSSLKQTQRNQNVSSTYVGLHLRQRLTNQQNTDRRKYATGRFLRTIFDWNDGPPAGSLLSVVTRGLGIRVGPRVAAANRLSSGVYLENKSR